MAGLHSWEYHLELQRQTNEWRWKTGPIDSKGWYPFKPDRKKLEEAENAYYGRT